MNTLKYLFACLLFAGLAFGQGSQFPLSPVQDEFGNAIVGAQVYVCSPTATQVPCTSQQATIYTDYTLAHVLTQPVVSDGSGNYTFGCTTGNYQLQVFAQGSVYTYKASCPSQSTGTITGITTAAGSGLTGGGTSGVVSLGLIQTCSNNQVLIWNGSSWVCSNNGSVTGATANGGLLLSGNTLGLITSCSPNQVLAWNGSAWACASTGSGTLTGASAHGGLLVTGTTIGLLTSCSNNQILQWNTTDWVCANAGAGTVTGATANGGLALSSTTLGLITSCSSTQVLAWNGSAWACANNGSGTITGASAHGGLVASGTTLGLILTCSNGQGLTWNTTDWVCTTLTTGAVLLNPAGTQTITQPSNQSLTVTGAPTVFQGGGNVNGITVTDSGANAQVNSAAGTAQFASGTLPGTNQFYTTSYLPIWTVNVGSFQYTTALEGLANKDQLNGYPSLGSTGQVPIAELLASTSGCTSSTFVLGDFSGCGAGSSNVPFGSVTTGTNNSATLTCDTGCSIVSVNSGSIRTNKIGSVAGFTTYPSSAIAADQTVISTLLGIASYTTLPNCPSTNQSISYSTATHTFGCNTVVGQTPAMTLAQCTSSTCPNGAAYTGTGAQAIAAQFTIPAATLNVGKCAVATAWFSHTGAASVHYNWNVGGTGSLGGAVSGGTSSPDQVSSQTCGSGLCEASVVVCAQKSGNVYMRNRAMQTGSTQVAGNTTESISFNLAISENVNFLFNVANTDSVTFDGGFINFP